jgi:inner membrane protein
MPSPIGHAIGGVTAAWAGAGRSERPREWLAQALVLGAVGMLPDIDLLFGVHSGPTHSIGAAVIAGLIAWPVAWLALRFQAEGAERLAGAERLPLSGEAARWALAVSLAWMAHFALDWLGEDTSPPFGVMVLWPFSREHYMSPVPLMPAITRRYWLPGFWTQNFRALIFELMVLLPVLAGVWWLRRRPSRRRPRS